MLLTKFLLL